ncbi:MAG: DUF5103 domain-containing protein [Bacteroidia bacterium]|jgi:hypothetical protein|nr:DUF5103 domain-containing protein [Bacteroidia bacterium]
MKTNNILWPYGLLFLCMALAGCPATTREMTSPEPRRLPLMPDHIYQANIHSVQLYRPPLEATYPVIYLDARTSLYLEFDELLLESQPEHEYYVDIISCDMNWQPSSLLPIDFYEGFTQDRIDIYQRSEFTKIPYVHYRYEFPQEHEYFKLSGNYLLKVFRAGNPEDLVLTRRFVVADRRVGLGLKYELSGRMERQRLTDLSFEVSTRGLQVINPAQDLKIRVLQNFRWETAAVLTQPRWYGDETFEYVLRLPDAFVGGNEFRRHEITSLRLYSESVQLIEAREAITDVYLFPDEVRRKNTYGSRRDRNGTFQIFAQEWSDADVQADYVQNYFFLQSPPLPDSPEVYLMGAFSDWQLRPAYRLDYNTLRQRYEGEVLLKQGIYDYTYAIKGPKGHPVETPLEGPHADSENFYTILVYYRGPTDRNDHLIGFLPVNYIE